MGFNGSPFTINTAGTTPTDDTYVNQSRVIASAFPEFKLWRVELTGDTVLAGDNRYARWRRMYDRLYSAKEQILCIAGAGISNVPAWRALGTPSEWYYINTYTGNKWWTLHPNSILNTWTNYFVNAGTDLAVYALNTYNEQWTDRVRIQLGNEPRSMVLGSSVGGNSGITGTISTKVANTSTVIASMADTTLFPTGTYVNIVGNSSDTWPTQQVLSKTSNTITVDAEVANSVAQNVTIYVADSPVVGQYWDYPHHYIYESLYLKLRNKFGSALKIYGPSLACSIWPYDSNGGTKGTFWGYINNYAQQSSGYTYIAGCDAICIQNYLGLSGTDRGSVERDAGMSPTTFARLYAKDIDLAAQTIKQIPIFTNKKVALTEFGVNGTQYCAGIVPYLYPFSGQENGKYQIKAIRAIQKCKYLDEAIYYCIGDSSTSLITDYGRTSHPMLWAASKLSANAREILRDTFLDKGNITPNNYGFTNTGSGYVLASGEPNILN